MGQTEFTYDGGREPQDGRKRSSLRSLAERLRPDHGTEVVSLAHEDYEGRNVLSIVVRNEFADVVDVPGYTDQPVFGRAREIPPTGRRAADER